MKESQLVMKKEVVRVTLELTKEETQLIFVLVSRGINGGGTVWNFGDNIYKKFLKLGFKYDENKGGDPPQPIDTRGLNLDYCEIAGEE